MENEKQAVSDRLRWLKKLRAGIPKTSEKITPETLEIWSRRLAQVPMPTLFAAANVLLERHTFFPALAQILDVVRELEESKQDRDWVKRVEGWKQEALGPGEAAKLLAEVTEKAGISLVPSKPGFSRIGRKR